MSRPINDVDSVVEALLTRSHVVQHLDDPVHKGLSGGVHFPLRVLPPIFSLQAPQGVVVMTGILQVWSLTQFYSVDFSQSRIRVNKCVFTYAQSRFASVVVDDVLGPPRLALHT